MTSSIRGLLVACLIGLSACAHAPGPAPSPAAASPICAPITEPQVAALFDRWNQRVAIGRLQAVVANDAPESILLPSLSKRPRLSATDKPDDSASGRRTPRGRWPGAASTDCRSHDQGVCPATRSAAPCSVHRRGGRPDADRGSLCRWSSIPGRPITTATLRWSPLALPQGKGTMARTSARIRWGAFALASCVAGIASAGERELAITTPVVAAAPGTTAFPQVEISYVGGERGDAFQIAIPAVSGLWTWVGTPQAVPGEFEPSCAIAINGSLFVIGTGTGSGTHDGPTPICRASVAVAPGVSNGIRSLPATAPALLECFDAQANPVPCGFAAGTLLVGNRTGTASIAYTPPPGSTVALGTTTSTIGVTYLPGSAGDGVVVSGCRLAGDAVVRAPRTSPPYLGFAGTTPVSASIALACIGGLPAGDATLTCDERINDGALQPRSWLLACPETRVAPTIDYGPPPGTTIVAAGGEFAGDPATATVTVTIRNDGLGAGLPASSAVSDCSADAPFVAEQTPSPITGEGTNGATGTVALTCVTATAAVDRVLSCSERRGSTRVTRTWPLRCPARPSPVLYADGFEPVTAR